MKNYRRLSQHDEGHVEKALAEMITDPHYPALRTKRLRATHHLCESSATLDIRIVWHDKVVGVIALLDVGHHDLLTNSGF
jgi:hypothetical protein